MVRLSLANCPGFNFFPTAPKGDEVTAILVKLQHRNKRLPGSQRTKLSFTKGSILHVIKF